MAIARRLRCAAMTILLMGSVLCLGGCPPEYHDVDTFMKHPRPLVGGRPYVIEPPDGIQIIAPNAPEIHNVSVSVRPDGYITLYLLGDVFAAGKTPTQLGSEIEEKILKYYEDVTVQVNVQGFNSKKYYVAGEAGAGPRGYNGKDTILDALIGSVGRTSWPEKCVIIRPNEQPEMIRRMSFDLTKMYEVGDLSRNALIEEGDIVYVPMNPIAAVGVFIENLLSPVAPITQAVNAPAAYQAVAHGLVP